MQNIEYGKIITILVISIWFIFPLGLFISLIKQNRESLPPPDLNLKKDSGEKLKIFEHQKMIYANDSEVFDELIEEYEPPHVGIGSTQPHHLH